MLEALALALHITSYGDCYEISPQRSAELLQVASERSGQSIVPQQTWGFPEIRYYPLEEIQKKATNRANPVAYIVMNGTIGYTVLPCISPTSITEYEIIQLEAILGHEWLHFLQWMNNKIPALPVHEWEAEQLQEYLVNNPLPR